MPSLTSHTVYDPPTTKQLPKSSTTNEASKAPAPASTQQAPTLSKAEAVAYLDAAVQRVDLQLARLVENVVGAMEIWEWYAFGGEEMGGEGEEGAGC
ncbi:hypothetical protein MMC32_005597 [Xylographa parallela]|nr:hypothetical protein [Xylographa parallela]